MKKTFGIMGMGVLLVSTVLMSFNNVTFGMLCGLHYAYGEVKSDGCYVFSHDYYVDSCSSESDYIYSGTELLTYKCDAEGGTVDLRNVPLERGQYLAAIGENAFSGTNVTKVIIPSTVGNIGNGAFCSVEKEGNICGNAIIEAGEECDDGNTDRGNGYTKCSLNCTIMDLPNCGNGQEDAGETCGNCPEDIYCGKSSKGVSKGVSSEPGNTKLFDDSDFVEVEFQGGMNFGLNPIMLGSACAKTHEYTVTFKTEDGEVLGEMETQYQHINSREIPAISSNTGLIGAWYLGNELFVLNSTIHDDITLVYKYKNGGIEKNDDEGFVKVFLGDQEVIVKNKDQGAENSINSQEPGGDAGLDVIGYYYFWGNNVGLDIKQVLDENSGIIDTTKFPEGFDHGYLGLDGGNDWMAGSKDTPCNPLSGEYLPSPDDWKLLMQLWGKLNGYEVLLDSLGYVFYPNGSKGETKGASQVAYQFPNKFANDFLFGLFPSIYIDDLGVDYNDFLFYPSSMDNGQIGYFSNAGLYLVDSPFFDELNNVAMSVRCFIQPKFEISFDVDGGTQVVTQMIFSGNKAIEPETQKENAEFLGWFTEDGTKFDFDTSITSDIKLYAKWQEKKTNNGHSGGGGGGSSSSSNSVNNSDKLDDSFKDKVSSDSKEKENSTSEEKLDKNQQDNVLDNNGKQNEKTETIVSLKVSYVPSTNLSEKEQAYDFAYKYGITTKTSVESAEVDMPLTRIQMAKMLSKYALNVLGKQPDISKGTTNFNDVTNKMDRDYDNGVTLAYQLGIMGINMPNNNFRPNDEVTRAEFVAAFSRMLYGTSDGEYKSTSKYYTHHMEKLKSEGIVTNTNPSMKERRGYVMIMLMRSVTK